MGDAQKSELMVEDLLIFEQSGQKYAVRSAVVREVLRAFSAVTLPKAPPIVEGILNVRGEIIPLLNMRRRFGLPELPPSVTDHFVIAWEGTRWVALRVDRVLNLERLPVKKTSDAGKYISSAELVDGVATGQDGMILIHDLGRFLGSAEKQALTQALTHSTGTGGPTR
ncbi:MAG: purine-binding chemotaxis protein CheW [Myxococcales bacterium]|nr:purine-binding chemotaxis protein CheW [Myxococcales bacterium]